MDGPIVISVPAREIANFPGPGSVFDAALLKDAPISPELRVAVNLISTAHRAVQPRSLIRCVVRPEIFTHGHSLNWLTRKLEGVTDHACLCDGTSVKLIPHLRNHLFTYGLHSHQHNIDFKKLMYRAPELLSQFHSQINTYHRVATKGLAHEPKPLLVRASVPFSVNPVWFHGFYLNPNSLEDSAARMLEWGEMDGPRLAEFKRVTYVPLTESAAKDAQFQRLVAEMIASAYFSSSACVLIRVPLGNSQLTERMRLTLEGIRAAARNLPQARSTNIFLLSGDLPEELLTGSGARLSLLLHQTFDYWRYTLAVYRQAREVAVFLDQDCKRPSEAAKHLLRDAFGQTPRLILSSRESDETVSE